MANVRPPVLSGSWYPGEPERLRSTVEEFLAAADSAGIPTGRPRVAVVPHAGYVYSGQTAGKLYGLLVGLDYDTVFVLSPSHRTALAQVALSSCTGFSTPLGRVAIDGEINDRLAQSSTFAYDDQAHALEHAVEIQLPFLQVVFGEALRVVPLLVPRLSDDDRREAAAALAPWRNDRCLFVVSTDFTHYGHDYGYVPFTDDVPDRLEKLDGEAIDLVLRHDPEGLIDYGQRTGITMCGLHATALAISGEPPPGMTTGTIDYCRSGDRDRNYTFSVSYAALLLNATDGDTGETDLLTAQEKDFLLKLARDAVTAAVEKRPPTTATDLAAREGVTLSSRLTADRGAFVTLSKSGVLRGCIGYIEGIRPLIEAVQDNGRSAALQDPRFPPVGPDELEQIHIEVSALTPLQPVSGPEAIEIGRHGIVMQHGPAKSVFLPQVAPQQGWDLETTLSQLASKAGLPPDAWRSGTTFSVFEAEILEEEPAP